MATRFRTEDALSAVGSLAASLGVGHRIHRRRFQAGDLEVDCEGRVCVVTGASSGLGLAAARGLAERGATVILVSRDPGRAEGARREVERAARGRAEVRTELADLSSLAGVRSLAGRIAERSGPISVLLHNAGVLAERLERTAEGHEATFATNVLGPFLLTALLLPRLAEAAPSRIIHVSSTLMFGQKLDVDALLREPEARGFSPMRAYLASKRAQVELSAVWAERLAGARVTSNAMFPGVAQTPGAERAFPRLVRATNRLKILRTADEGADTMLWLAVARAAAGETGKLWFDRQALPAHAVPWTRGSGVDGRRLFEACEALCGVKVSGNPRVVERATEELNDV